jgi:hypothetical protein
MDKERIIEKLTNVQRVNSLIEQMMMCGNCTYYDADGQVCNFDKELDKVLITEICQNWELKER